jgi:hypothetical protein
MYDINKDLFQPGDLVEWYVLHDRPRGIILEWVPPYVKTLEPLGGYRVYFSESDDGRGDDDIILHEELKLLSSN